jgi:hypothetical protein
VPVLPLASIKPPIAVTLGINVMIKELTDANGEWGMRSSLCVAKVPNAQLGHPRPQNAVGQHAGGSSLPGTTIPL